MKEVNRSGQVWIETVIYTMIALVLIATVLAFVKPQIEKMQDKVIIEQSIVMMKDIDLIISDIVQGGAGNQRKIELGIKKGSLEINGITDELSFVIESRYEYSEPGKDISDGNLLIKTISKGKTSIVNITRDYSPERDITYSDEESIKTLGKTSTASSILISNNGESIDGRTIIDFEVK